MRCGLIVFFLLPITLLSQTELSGNGMFRVFRSLEEASEVNPDSVHYLDLGNNNLKKFPDEVFRYKNLYSLSFADHNIDYYYKFRPALLTEEEKKIVEEGRKKFGYNNRCENLYPFNNRNSFTDVPERIKELTALELFTVNEGALKTKKLKKIKRLLPNRCDIYEIGVYPDSSIVIQK